MFSTHHCTTFIEDPAVCDDVGKPKGQCALCGSKESEHFVGSEVIGFLVDGALHCPRCAPVSQRRCPVWHANVYPYKGTCRSCGTVLVEPQTPAWPELF